MDIFQKGLVQKIILEKDKPVADVFLASDISRLIDVAEAGASIKIIILLLYLSSPK